MKNYTNETAWGQNINILIIGTDDGIFKSNSANSKPLAACSNAFSRRTALPFCDSVKTKQ